MSRKVIAIIGMALALAVSGGVIAFINDKNPQQNQTDATTTASDPTTVEVADLTEEIPEDMTIDIEIDESEFVEDTTEDDSLPTSADVEPSVPYEEQIINASMSIQYVVDQSTGAQESARVVFGEDYKYCYAAFDADKTFEMCLDPTAGTIRKGTYEIYGNVVSVVYEDGSGSEYDILTDESGNITHVIVNYGDYAVYFG